MTNLSGAKSLSGKVAIITGGGTGIGRAAAEAFVAEGARVVVVGRRDAPLKQLASEHNGKIEYFQADIAQSGKSKDIIAYAIEVFGRLDILVNNAATAALKPLTMLSDEDIDQMLTVNLRALLAMSRDAIPELEKTKGSVINLSSVAAQTALPGMAGYAATKSGVDRLSKILANELGPLGIRVNVVSPGLTQTDMLSAMPDEAVAQMVDEATALRRLGQPEDIARTILWLASDQSNWVTGQIIQSSGGLMVN